jgi:hypothetical protein
MDSGKHQLVFNGVNGSTGRALAPPLDPEDVARLACGEAWDPAHLADLKEHKQRLDEDDLGLALGFDPRRLDEAGWGVIFPHDVAEDLRRSLAPLLDHRRAQAGRTNEGFYREFTYRPGESKPKFLARHGVGPGPVDPHDLPYYLLIVGSPRQIPFSFQFQLDVQYGVGRLEFETFDDYAAYATTVVTAETAAAGCPRTMALFGVANADDRATQRSLHNLVEPLAERLEETWGRGAALPPGQDRWRIESVLAEEATKDRLARLLGGEATPAVLFTASHGIGFDLDDPRQLPHQGALLCQDWPGPRQWAGPIPPGQYFSADDVGGSAALSGLIAFHFACYGAGTPRFDQFAHRGKARSPLAPHDFVARLPQRLLAHPRGGALAAVGHVDRAWSYSFDWPEAPRQLSVFTSCLGALFEGFPVGAATEYFNQRYAELAADLSAAVEDVKYGIETDALHLSGMWTANNDARSYVVLGDPAVRLAVK